MPDSQETLLNSQIDVPIETKGATMGAALFEHTDGATATGLPLYEDIEIRSWRRARGEASVAIPMRVYQIPPACQPMVPPEVHNETPPW